MIDLESGSLCPDNNELEIPMRNYRIDRINRTHRALSLDFSFAHPVNNNAEIGLIVEKWSEGVWRAIHVFPTKFPFCKIADSHVKTFQDIFVNLKKGMGLKNSERCDIPAGNYSVRTHYEIREEIPFWDGRFRSTFVLKRIATGKKIFCVKSLVNLVEVPQ